jgi:chitin synthase
MFLAELSKRRTKNVLDDVTCYPMDDLEQEGGTCIKESEFWEQLINQKLKPVSHKLTQTGDIHKSLQSLRNMTLAILLLINMMWIILLASLTFWQLEQYGIDPHAFQLLFLAVYSLIILIQFFTMLAHRGVTLVHYLGRVKPREVTVRPWQRNRYQDGFEVISMNTV